MDDREKVVNITFINNHDAKIVILSVKTIIFSIKYLNKEEDVRKHNIGCVTLWYVTNFIVPPYIFPFFSYTRRPAG